MIAQLLIVICGVSAVWLSQDERLERRRYACIFGLLGQPAWFYSAWTAQQWGIFFVCFLYAACWMKGFWQHWLKSKWEAA